jgi:integration host factor subunit beta
MIKSQMALQIASQSPHVYPKQVEKAVDAVLGEIVAAMRRRDRMELRGFGAFIVKFRQAHMARNPKTGTSVHVLKKLTPAFKASKEMGGRLNPDSPMASGGNDG